MLVCMMHISMILDSCMYDARMVPASTYDTIFFGNEHTFNGRSSSRSEQGYYGVGICGLSVASSDSFIWQALDNVQWTISILIEEIPPRLESRQKLAGQKAGSCWSTDRLMHLLARN